MYIFLPDSSNIWNLKREIDTIYKKNQQEWKKGLKEEEDKMKKEKKSFLPFFQTFFCILFF